MRKIFIVGIVASGKTTLAKQLGAEMKICWYELDSIVYYQTGDQRVKRTPDEQVEVIMDIDRKGSWIMEGTDRESYRCLYEMADTIIFLDPPLWKRRIRIFTRFLKQKLHIEQCQYKADLAMLKMMYKWTSDFEKDREAFEANLSLYNHKLIRLTDNKRYKQLITMDFR
ncbi:hypothetical protein QPK24_11535 [Paenibacillus polygoni]|uniref:Adenylate kinase n=1 Tax=Paenibacillus polygoni TaxID=3050112 RepID=A0ABY8X866_9BACL|nr:hypothetical protein [Paenibacillus polygoni]WIV21258.1 hypothetical protein QPK24_11535 [Paenibacillus polygoni]